MKKIKYIFLSAIICIAAIALVFQSCNNESGIPSSDSASKIAISSQYDYLDLPTEYKQVGQFHNEGMDSVYKAVQAALASSSKATNAKRTSSNKEKSQKVTNTCDLKSVINDATLKYCRSNNLINKNYATSSMSRVKTSADIDSLSPIQKEYLDKISEIVKSEYKNKDLAGMKEKLNKINCDAKKNLEVGDAANIYIASTVAYASMQYWKKNIEKWYLLLKADEIEAKYGNTLSKANRFKLKAYELPEVVVTADAPWWMSLQSWWNANGEEVVKADLIGAAYEGLKGGLTAAGNGLMFGPEGAVLAAGGGAITGAVKGAIEGSALGVVGTMFHLW